MSVLNSFQYLSSSVDLHILSLIQYALYRIPLHVLICIICFIIALFSKLQKHPPHYVNTFIIYISVTIILEIICWFYSLQKKNNLIFYNLYIIPNFTYLFYLVRSFIINEKVRKMLVWTAAIYPVLAIINMIFIQGLAHFFNTYSFILGCTIIVMTCIFYFYERIKYPGPKSLLHDPTFWVSTSLLFYYTCSLPLTGILNTISDMPFYVYKTILFINVVINIILYLLFSISFICNLIFRRSS